MQFSLVDLSSLRLPSDGPLLRHGAPDLSGFETQWEFDFRTLIYDAFSRGDQIVLVCPRLRNLWPVLRDGLMRNEPKITIRRLVRHRFETVIIDTKIPGRLVFAHNNRDQVIEVGSDLNHDFENLRCLVTMVKNEPISWIKDWVQWHVEVHGSEALVLFDNNSKALDVKLLAKELSFVEGLKKATLVRAPFPYGAPSGGRFKPPAMFLQVAMLNLARWRMFSRARSVLSVDVDELVQPLSGSSIHIKAEESHIGLVSFAGKWVFSTKTSGATSHREHTHSFPTGGVSKNPKWCIVPASISNRFPWAVHRPGGPLSLFSNTFAEYWHFRSVSTGWNRSVNQVPTGLQEDRELISAVSSVLA